jgi:NAD(P)-dependent dehydrogenase (short-subunit alcohol dehydrogenase family)
VTSDRVLLITGASSGIGAATARAGAAEGWRLVLAARSIDVLEDLALELGGPDRAVAVECDVTDWADQQAAVIACLEQFGRLDAAWANAGFGGQRSFLAGTVDHWREMVLTNVYGVALTIRAAMPALKESKGHLQPLLQRCAGKSAKYKRSRGLARNLLKIWPALWTFSEVDGVEPTNNAAERGLRGAVIYRKLSLGSQSETGEHTIERLLSASVTCRLQRRSPFTYLTDVLNAKARRDPVPSLA